MPNEPVRKPAEHLHTPARREGYEVSYLARRYGISQSNARDLVNAHGQDWAKLDQAAKALKKQ